MIERLSDRTMDIPGEAKNASTSRPLANVHTVAAHRPASAGSIVGHANDPKPSEYARAERPCLPRARQSLREQTGCAFVTRSALQQCLQPGQLDDQLIVTAKLQGAGRASLTIQQHALLVNTDNQPMGPAPPGEGPIRGG
jgi:acyl-CoA thioester hydrolase